MAIKKHTKKRELALWLKDHFIPHAGNNHRPHLLHRGKIIWLVLALVFIEMVFLLQITVIMPNLKLIGGIMPLVLGELTNKERETNRLGDLIINPLLETAAANKARDMAEKSYFAHESPGGRMPWDWIEEAGYNYSYAGENLAVNFVDSEDVVSAWMRSPSHRQNILNDSYKEIGFGMAKGIYKNKEAIFIVQMFGSPAETTEPVIKPAIVSVSEKPETKTDIVAVITSTASQIPSKGAVSGVSVEKTRSAKIIDKIIVSPRHTANWILYFMLGVSILALILNILIEIKIQHPDLIANGIFLVCILTSAIAANHYLSLLKGAITLS